MSRTYKLRCPARLALFGKFVRVWAAPTGLLLALTLIGMCRAFPANGDGDYVVLLHGLGRSSLSMKALEFELRRQGYEVVNVSYPSTRVPVHQVAREILPKALSKSVTNHNKRVHFVTHSLGGIIIREYLKDRRMPGLGRVVMLAPPNHGSEVADKLKRVVLLSRLLGPAGRSLGTSQQSVPARLGPANFELGIIAGDRSFNPLFSAWLPGQDDGKVSVESTRLDGMTEHIVVHRSHTWMMWRRDVLSAVSCFLRSGTFGASSR